MFPLRGTVGPDGLRQAQRGQLKLARGGSCVGTNDRIRRIIMPRLGLSRLYWASIRAYWAGAVEMELTESRQPGEAWARHRGARAGVFGEAPRGREIVQASIPPTSRPLQPWRRSPGRAAADRFANACGAAFAETAPKGRWSRRASS